MLVDNILLKCIDPYRLIKTTPELFDFSKINFQEKITLMRERPGVFFPLFRDSITTLTEKISVLLEVNNKKVREQIELSEEELKTISSEDYFRLLNRYFKKYIRADLFENLTNRRKCAVTLIDPKWVFENISPIPKLTSDVIETLSSTHPELIDQYITDFSGYSTRSIFWLRMIKFNKKYKRIFLENTRTLITKTDVRSIIRYYPEIIKELDEHIIANSKLNIKEWILLCNSIIRNKKIFKNWEFSPEMKEILKLDSLAEVLSGKSTMTRHFTNAISGVLGSSEDEEEV